MYMIEYLIICILKTVKGGVTYFFRVLLWRIYLLKIMEQTLKGRDKTLWRVGLYLMTSLLRNQILIKQYSLHTFSQELFNFKPI